VFPKVYNALTIRRIAYQFQHFTNEFVFLRFITLSTGIAHFINKYLEGLLSFILTAYVMFEDPSGDTIAASLYETSSCQTYFQ
jgi:hypothetical protein